MLAPLRRQIPISPPDHANRPAQIPPAGRPCWRGPAGKALSHRRATPTGRRKSRPAGAHVGAAPPSKPYPTVGSRQQSGPNPARRPSMLAPPRRQSLIPPPGHANRPAKIPPGGRPCWHCPAVKALSYRRATPTVRPETRLSADHVGAAPPAKPYLTAGPRQQAGENPARRPPMLAPFRRQSLIPPPGHANRPARIPPAGRPCWRLSAGKALSHRLTTPTGRLESCLPAVHVGASSPAKPYPTVGPRQQATLNPACRPSMLAPLRRQNFMPPSGNANRPAQISPDGRPCWRPESCLPADHVGAAPPAKPYPTAWPRQQAPPRILFIRKFINQPFSFTS